MESEKKFVWQIFDDKSNTFHQRSFDHVYGSSNYWGMDFIYKEIYEWEFSPENCVYELWDCVLKDEDVVVDLGANVGFFTRKASAKASKVVAIEGSPEAFSCLVRNTSDLPHVFCLNACVTGQGKGDPYLWSVKGNPLQMKLESVFELYGLEKIDFLKCDIEGGEYALFKSLDPTLLNKIDRIAVETHSEEENVSFHLPGKIRHEFFWDYGGGSQTMFYFITPK